MPTEGKQGAAVAAGQAKGRIVRARRRPSLRGRLVASLAVPWLMRRGDSDAPIERRIMEDRRKGPALAPDKMRDRYACEDLALGGLRTLRLAPQGSGDAEPLHILYIHGGAYVFDLMPLQWTMAAAIAHRTGAVVSMPLYPLAPEADVQVGLASVEEAYLALVEAVGARNIVIMGDSAGGGLTLALAHRLRDARRPLPLGLLLLFPWLDATLSDPSQPGLENHDPILTIDLLKAAGRLWGGTRDADHPAVSPLFADQSGLPPALVVVGTHDVLLPDAERLAERMGNAEVVIYPDMFHGFTAAPIPEARDAFDRMAAFTSKLRQR